MKLGIRWCEFAYNEIFIWSLLLTWMHYLFYSFQLFSHACLVKGSDLMLYLVENIYWVLANIALVIATTLRDLEQTIEFHMQIYYPIDLLCLQNLHAYVLMIDVLCWQRRQSQYLMFYIIAWFYICLHLSTLSVCYEAFASQNPVLSMITTRACRPEPKDRNSVV